MGEKWILKSEKRINLEGDHKKFKISDKHIEVERTEFFIQLIFGVAGLAFLVLLNILENFWDLVVVFLGICVIVLLKNDNYKNVQRFAFAIFSGSRQETR